MSVYSALLLGAALFVLLIACVNVANLQFARAAVRWRKSRSARLWARAAAGWCANWLPRHGAGGGRRGCRGSCWPSGGWPVLQAHVPAELVRYNPGLAEIGLNRHALVFTLVAALGSGILAGLLPAWRCSRANLTESLRPGRHWMRSVLVAGEVALAAVLLVGAGLMVRGFRTLVSSSTGLEPSSMLTLHSRFRKIAIRPVIIARCSTASQRFPACDRRWR